MTLSVTTLNVSARGGSNGRPLGGWAVFSDGKAYDWLRLPLDPRFGGGALRFFTSRRTHDGHGHALHPFDSAPRAKALETALEAI